MFWAEVRLGFQPMPGRRQQVRPLPPLQKRAVVELEIMALGVPSDQVELPRAGRRQESYHIS